MRVVIDIVAKLLLSVVDLRNAFIDVVSRSCTGWPKQVSSYQIVNTPAILMRFSR